MNKPILERRQLKKELGGLKRYVKNFWYYHQLDKEMSSFYGGYSMSDDEAKKRVDETKKQIQELENRLSVL